MKKVFLIDDDEDDHFFFKGALESIAPQCFCETAMNGKSGLDKLKSMEVLPDVIFIDLKMPLLNGFDLLTAIKNDVTLHQIPVGIYSTSNIIGDIEHSQALGASFYLAKPYAIQMLSNKLQQILSTDFSIIKYLEVT